MTDKDRHHCRLGFVPVLAAVLVGALCGVTWADADFGDAPDQAGSGQFGFTKGHYPTKSPTGNTTFPGRTGPYHADLSEEVLGVLVDGEPGAKVINRDFFDDGFAGFFFLVVQIPVPCFTLVRVTIPAHASPGTRYINMAADLNQDGKWAQYTDVLGTPVDEWVVKNFQFDVPTDIAVGQTKDFILPAFGWGSGLLFAYPTWFRLTLTESPLNAADFGLSGWDGSGPGSGFATG